MNPQCTLRAAHAVADDGEIARIVTALYPDAPLTAAEVTDAARRRGQRLHRKLVADLGDGRLAGYGFYEVPDVAALPGRLRVRVSVDPAWQQRGIGRALYAAIEAQARAQGATELCTEANDGHPRGERFARAHGFVLYNRRIESRLPLAAVAPAAIARAIDAHTDRAFASGVRVASYRQLALADDAPRCAYELTSVLWRDVPFGISGPDPTYESFVAEELNDPAFRPGASFVALDGARWIGECLQTVRDDVVYTMMTGVVRAWRGRGIARWLKLHAIRAALELRAREMRTWNDEANAAMIGLNRALGYAAHQVDLRFRKELR
jgi:GNAT superfamily N-acetyltransferase